MLHETLNIQKIWSKSDWQDFYKKYESSYPGQVNMGSGRLLLRRDRQENLPHFLNDISRIYNFAQYQYEKWRKNVWNPLNEELKSLAVDDKVFFHAKPTHKYNGGQNQWWLYEYSKSPPPYGWGFSFKWVDEPAVKLNYELGQKFYDLDHYQSKFSGRTYILEKILAYWLEKYVYSLYDYDWLHRNMFSGKLIKINLHTDEYWFKIETNKNGVPLWKNFIWQLNDTEEINL